jgi:hypothetical protein
MTKNHTDAQRAQAWLLRLGGATEILAFFAVVMPRSWMAVAHAWLGLGEMPGGPVLIFLARQASFVYGMHGILLWIIASDVVRFRPLVIFTGISFLIAAPVFFIIDYTAGMPLWWTVGDSAGCAFFGAGLLLLDRYGRASTA